MTTPMSRDELKTRCEALAGVGDTAAAATLLVLEELAAAATSAEMAEWHWKKEVVIRDKRIAALESKLRAEPLAVRNAFLEEKNRELAYGNVKRNATISELKNEVAERDKKIEELQELLARAELRNPQEDQKQGNKLTRQTADFRYIVDKIRNTIALADGLLGTSSKPEVALGGRAKESPDVFMIDGRIVDLDAVAKGEYEPEKVVAAATKQERLEKVVNEVLKRAGRDIATRDQEMVSEFVGVLLNGRPIGDATPSEPARVPRPQPAAERGRTDGKTEGPSVEEAGAIASLAKEFGISDNEARAVAGSRKNMGLPVEVDPAVTQITPTGPAGAYDKAIKNDPGS